jgi:CBS domain-containing protein
MKIAALFHRTVIKCSNRDHGDVAMSLLWRHNVGCMPVVGDRGELVGMITDRDLAMGAFLQGAPLRAVTVSSVMTKELATCTPDDDVEAVLGQMTGRRLRRLPVVDAEGALIGIVSLNDIARAAVANELPAAGVAAVLAALATPRSLASTAP